MKKYFQPKSLSWWAAVVEAGINVARYYGVPIPPEVDGLVLAVFGIGIRGAVGEKK